MGKGAQQRYGWEWQPLVDSTSVRGDVKGQSGVWSWCVVMQPKHCATVSKNVSMTCRHCHLVYMRGWHIRRHVADRRDNKGRLSSLEVQEGRFLN